MDKRVLLVANYAVPYGGRLHGVGMQFDCDEAAAADLVKSGQASLVAPAPPAPSAAKPAPAPAPVPFAGLEPDPKR